MQNVNAWMVIRDGEPVAVRFSEGRAMACKTLEERTYHHEEVKVVPVTIFEGHAEPYGVWNEETGLTLVGKDDEG